MRAVQAGETRGQGQRRGEGGQLRERGDYWRGSNIKYEECVTCEWVSVSCLRLDQGAGRGAEPRHEESSELTLNSEARDTHRLSSCDLAICEE